MNGLKSLLDKFWRGFPPNTPTIVERNPQLGYRDLVRSLQQVTFQTDLKGILVFLSPNWEKLTGFSARESTGAALSDYMHPEDRGRCQEYIGSLCTSAPGEETVITLRCLHKDAGSRWVEIHINPAVADDESHPVVGVVGTLSDVTGRVRKEQLDHASRRTLESLIGNLPGMFYRCRNDQDWSMDFVSPGSVELTGYTPENLINNKRPFYARLIHTYDRQRVWNEIQTALSENRPFDLEYRIITQQGEEKWVWERGKGIFSTNGEVLALEGYVTDITKNKRAEQRARDRLLYDPDSGLPSVALFMDRLQCAVREFSSAGNRCFVLGLLELDRFGDLRSKYGVATAERVVGETGRRLLGVLDSYTTLTRLSENSFGVLLAQLYELKAANTIVRQIQERVLLPFTIDDVEVYATGSIGVTLSSTGYESGENMLRDAATALSRAKALGGARYEVFDLHQHAKATAQAHREREIKDAMSKREMSVYWQPVIALSSGKLVGLEARLGWRHPRGRMLFAEQYVPDADNTQLIIPLWEYMLSDACEQMTTWQSLPDFADTGISIEIFGRTLLDANAILRLGERLLESKPASFSLALGIPEAVLMQETLATEQMLTWLKSRKIRLILDSFGAGSCSLSTMRQAPLDMLRIHPSLVEDNEEGGPFIQAIVTLAHARGIKVIADRIQSNHQLSTARKHGVDFAQGELISPPVDGVEVASLLTRKRVNLRHGGR